MENTIKQLTAPIFELKGSPMGCCGKKKKCCKSFRDGKRCKKCPKGKD
jgi:hypothetical protein